MGLAPLYQGEPVLMAVIRGAWLTVKLLASFALLAGAAYVATVLQAHMAVGLLGGH